MWKAVLKGAFVWNRPISIIEFPKTLFVAFDVLSNVLYPIHILVCTFSVLSIVFVLTDVMPDRFFSEFA
jgi:hypothetical protein